MDLVYMTGTGALSLVLAACLMDAGGSCCWNYASNGSDGG